MKKLLFRWVIMVVALIAAAYLTNLLPFSNRAGFVVDTAWPNVPRLFVGVAVLALVNVTLGKLLKLLTLPLNCLTLGIFSLVINAAMLMLVGTLDLGFQVNGFLSAFFGSIFMSIVASVLGSFLKDDDDDKEKD